MSYNVTNNSKLKAAFLVSALDSLRYVSSLVVFMRLAGLSDVAAVFGRWQVLVFTPIFGCVYLIPQRVLQHYRKEVPKAFHSSYLSYGLSLFFVVGLVLSAFFAFGTKFVMSRLGFEVADAVAKLSLGFSFGGCFHALNFANQNAFYAIDNMNVPVVANLVSFASTTFLNLFSLLTVEPSKRAFIFGLALSLGELSKLPVYYWGYKQQGVKWELPSKIKLVSEVAFYSPGLLVGLGVLSELTAEFFTLWRVASKCGAEALSVLNLALPLNVFFLLFITEGSQSYQAKLKFMALRDDSGGKKKIYRKTSFAAIIMPLVFIIFSGVSPLFDYYGLQADVALIGLLGVALTNLFQSHAFAMKQLLLVDKVVASPMLINSAVVWLTLAVSFLPGMDGFLCLIGGRVVAYAVQDLLFSGLARDWVARGKKSLAVKLSFYSDTKAQPGPLMSDDESQVAFISKPSAA